MSRISNQANITKFTRASKGQRIRKGLRIYQRHSIRPYGVVENAMQIAILISILVSFALLAFDQLGMTYIALMSSSIFLILLHIAAKINWKNARSTRSELHNRIKSSLRRQQELRMKSHERRARHFPDIEEAFINAGLFKSRITDKEIQAYEPKFHADTTTPLLGEMDTCDDAANNQPINDENTVYENYSITVKDIEKAFHKAGLMGRGIKSCSSIQLGSISSRAIGDNIPHHIGSLKSVGPKTKGSKQLATSTSIVAEEV